MSRYKLFRNNVLANRWTTGQALETIVHRWFLMKKEQTDRQHVLIPFVSIFHFWRIRFPKTDDHFNYVCIQKWFSKVKRVVSKYTFMPITLVLLLFTDRFLMVLFWVIYFELNRKSFYWLIHILSKKSLKRVMNIFVEFTINLFP
jgi:sensor histidine kinase YesM